MALLGTGALVIWHNPAREIEIANTGAPISDQTPPSAAAGEVRRQVWCPRSCRKPVNGVAQAPEETCRRRGAGMRLPGR